MAKFLCPTCKGKGHIVDPEALVFLPVVGWVAAILEKNSPRGLTRRTCTNCNGKKYIKVSL